MKLTTILMLTAAVTVLAAEDCDFSNFEGSWSDLRNRTLEITKTSWRMNSINYNCVRRSPYGLVMGGKFPSGGHVMVCLNATKYTDDILYLDIRTEKDFQFTGNENNLPDAMICNKKVHNVWDFHLFIRKDRTPVGHCPAPIQGNWQSTEAVYHNKTTNCHDFTVLSKCEQNVRFKLGNASACGDDKNLAINTDGKVNFTSGGAHIVDCVFHLNGSSQGYNYSIVRYYERAHVYHHYCLLYSQKKQGEKTVVDVILQEINFESSTTCIERGKEKTTPMPEIAKSMELYQSGKCMSSQQTVPTKKPDGSIAASTSITIHSTVYQHITVLAAILLLILSNQDDLIFLYDSR